MRLAVLARSGLAAFATCVAIGCESESQPPQAAEPKTTTDESPGRKNVVLVTIDTLRADALGAYQPGLDTSPIIDRLAREGIVFEQCATSSPSTLPSHASIFTGKQPYSHGLRSNSGYVLAADQRPIADVFRAGGFRTAAEISAPIISRRIGFDRGFDEYRDVTSSDVEHREWWSGDGGDRRRVSLDERPAPDVTRKAIDFLRRTRGEPFFLWLHYFDPHAPYVAAADAAARFPGGGYHAEVAYTDAAIEKLIDTIEGLGLRDETLVVVTSDHGESLGEHGEDTHSFLVYDATMRVPLILWGPSVLRPGTRIAAPVRTIDLAPTLLEWARLPALASAEGVSLWPLLRGGSSEERVLYGESLELYGSFGASMLRFVRVGAWKYIHKVNPELYDVSVDPGELNDRSAAEPERILAMRARLEALIGAAETARPGAASTALDAAQRAQLSALGYLADSGSASIDDEAASLQLVGLDPNSVMPDVKLLAEAFAPLGLGEPGVALEKYTKLAERHPRALPVLRGWIDSLWMLGRVGEAIPVLRRAVELAPEDSGLRVKLAGALLASGDLVEAELEARYAVERSPCGDLEVTYLSAALRAARRYADQRQMLEEVMERCDSDALRNEYAYFLATCPDDAQRDGVESLRLARSIAEGPAAAARPEYLDTLAAAYAENDRYDDAIGAAKRAIAALEGRSASEAQLAELRDHLGRFETRQPIRGD